METGNECVDGASGEIHRLRWSLEPSEFGTDNRFRIYFVVSIVADSDEPACRPHIPITFWKEALTSGRSSVPSLRGIAGLACITPIEVARHWSRSIDALQIKSIAIAAIFWSRLIGLSVLSFQAVIASLGFTSSTCFKSALLIPNCSNAFALILGTVTVLPTKCVPSGERATRSSPMRMSHPARV